MKRVEFYPVNLRHRLPTIGIPLRDSDADVPLDLQALVDAAYDEGRYGKSRYAEECQPPLTGEDATWADELLRAAGRRS